MSAIIGRKQEMEELERLYRSDRPEFVAVYGRRRVGKTFLIKQAFKDRITFQHTGVSPVDQDDEKSRMKTQLESFYYSMLNHGLEGFKMPKSWMEAFYQLEQLLAGLDDGKRQVVFIDEMPWMDTPRSGFITAFEHFWNGWGAGQDNLMLIVCGSATSWIQDNLVNSYGGLYDRVNAEIQLSPFTLHETERLLHSQEVTLSRYDILQLYMAVGGIPMYLSYVQPGLSLAQNIDLLYFNRKAKLKDEFERLFNSIFRSPEPYKAIIRLLANRQSGYSRDEISQMTGIPSGKVLSETLRALEASDFIELYQPFENNKRNKQYRLTDPFCLFYLDQVEGRNRKPNFWRDNENMAALNPWRGRAFENACLNHVEQIKAAMGVAGVASDNAPWTLRGIGDEKGMQLDLVISRSDRVINLCEMKFVAGEFEVKNDYEMKLRERIQWMVEHVSRRHNVQMTLVTTYGLKFGIHSGIFQRVVTLESLFGG